MKTCVMTGVQQAEMVEREIPAPGDDEVLVKIEYVGVCGSDLHYYEKGRIGNYIVEPPFVLGHECSGTVVQLGKGVKNLQIGDRVAMEPGKTCGHCSFCREGKYNLCPDVIFFATPPVDGVFQEYAAHEAALCFKLPAHVSSLEGAMVEPISVGFHAAQLGGAHVGQSALVFGAGCIGLSSMMALKAHGVTQTCVVDILQKRLDKAKELGAAEIINAGEEDVVKRIGEITEGRGVDIVIDTTGAEGCIDSAVQAVKKGGTIVLVGYSKTGRLELPFDLALDKEIRFETVFRYRHIYPMVIESIASGVVDAKGIVTHIFDFDETPEALDKCIHNKAEIVKAAIKVSE